MKFSQRIVQLAVICVSYSALAGPLEQGSSISFLSYNQEVRCDTAEAWFKPSNTYEVAEIIQQAIQNKKKVKAIGTLHSTNSLICSDGYVISTENLNKILGVEKNEITQVETVVVQPGVKLGDLTEYLHERGRSLGYAPVGFRAVSLGGLIATGAHGSSALHSASISARVESLTLIDSTGMEKEFNVNNTRETPDLMKAIRTHLGVFGVVVQIKLRIQPQFNIHMKTDFQSDKLLFQPNGLINSLNSCDFGEMLWFPNVEKFVRICGKETLESPNPGANNVFLSPNVATFWINLFQDALEIGARHRRFNQLLEKLRFWTYQSNPNFKKQGANGKMVTTNEVIGPSHRVISSELLSNAMGFPQANWEIAVPAHHTEEVLELIRNTFKEERLAAPTMGVLLRFIPSEPSLLLAHYSSDDTFKVGEPVALFELIIFSPKGLTPAKHDAYWARYQSLAETIIGNYQGRPHWGKNQDWFFKLAKKAGNYGEKWDRFAREVIAFDPDGMFSNTLTQGLIGLN